MESRVPDSAQLGPENTAAVGEIFFDTLRDSGYSVGGKPMLVGEACIGIGRAG